MADNQEVSDGTETILVHAFSELLGCSVLFFETYFVYQGIEIGHPVYAVIFCDLVVTLASSLINVAVLPFAADADAVWFTAAANGNSGLCLHFHCCCWVVLSVLRYLYIVKEKWMDEKLPGSKTRLLVAFAALAALFIVNVTSVMGTVVYFGYPETRVMDFPFSQKVTAMTVVMTNLMLMIMTSCLCYYQILRQKGHLMNTSVDAAVDAETSAGIFFIENVNHETLEMEIFKRMQNEAMLRQRKVEMRSAVVSLKTNLFFILVILIIILLATFLSSDILAAIVSLLKNLAPVTTSVTNFVKIQALMEITLETLLDNPLMVRLKIFCHCNQ